MRVTSHILSVTDPLLELMYRRTDICVFVKTVDLIKARGNKHHPTKLGVMQEELFIDVPNDPNSLPILLINCTYGCMVLVEGNNRHQFSLNKKRAWFPVQVRIEDNVLMNTNEGYDGFIAPVKKSAWFIDPLWKRKDKWRNDIRGVFEHVFNMETLDLYEESYDEEIFFTK